MKNIIQIIILVLFLFELSTHAQPYIYTTTHTIDSIDVYPYYLVGIQKLNLKNLNFEIVKDTPAFINDIQTDQKQIWIYVNYFNDRIIAYNTQNLQNYFELPDLGTELGGILFSGINEKSYIFRSSNDYRSTILSIIDNANKNIINNIYLPSNTNQVNSINREAFLSSDEHTLFLIMEDTSFTPIAGADKDYVTYFSTLTNQIIQQRRLSDMGFQNSDGYLLHRGRDGKGIVQSYFQNVARESYFRVYDFDSDSGSNFIYHQGLSEPFFTGNGESLLLAEMADSSDISYFTGKFFIYDLTTSNLIKTLTYPRGGEIYTFENYPNDIYYVLNLDTEPEIFLIIF